MAAPNIVNVTTITGKTAGKALSGQPQVLVSNPGQSNKVFKINALYISNREGSAAVNVDVYLQGVNESFYLASTISVPADSTLDILSKPIYLEEDWSIYVASGGQGEPADAICSYEEIS